MRPVKTNHAPLGRIRCRVDSGFALLEVLLSLVLLALGASAAMHLQTHSLQALQTAQWQLLAHQHAQSVSALSTAQRLTMTASDDATLALHVLQNEVQRQLPQGAMEVIGGSNTSVHVRWKTDRMPQFAVVEMELTP